MADVLPGPVPFIDLVAQYETIADELMPVVQEVFETQRFVLGDTVSEFEADVAKYCDSREAVGCASGTDAIVLALMGLDIGPGDEVITSPFTFFATAGAIHRVGAKAVFVDIEPDSFNIDAGKVEAAITDRTKALMPVHIFGQCAEMEPLWRLSVRHKLALIEDACQAIGSEYRGRRAGVLGTVGCFSFFPTKNLGGAGDGGIITTDDVELAQRMRRLRVHGEVGQYKHAEVGFNSRLDALQAAVLHVKLRHLDDWSNTRAENARRYDELIRKHGLLDFAEAPNVLPERRHIYNQYTLRIRGGYRDAVMQYLRDNGVGCAVYYPIPLHVQECFSYLGYSAGDLPQAEAASREVLSLPIFAELGAERQQRVIEVLAAAREHVMTTTQARAA